MDNFEIVRIADLHSAVEPAVTKMLGSSGFETYHPLKWVRGVDAPIRQMFCLSLWKGGQVAPTWGFSFDFVPHLSGNSIKWHRTSKTALLDIVVDARDESYDMPYHYGQAAFNSRIEDVIPKAISRANTFWDRYQNLSDMPEAYAWLKSHLTSGLGFYNYIQHPIALAFVLAINGQHEEGLIELEIYLRRYNLNEVVENKFRDLFKKAGAA
jgi:hypothetical protein